jgi:serine-type D-Ala-D-Ala carboxypeptidase/endopeptidase (penicillin-binding protein 4)
MRNLSGMALTAVAAALFSCSAAQKISKKTANTLLKDSVVHNAHLGISLYDAEAGKYLYNYQGDKYFVPASNTKLFTCYAGMKYLGDSLTGMRYRQYDTAIVLMPAGDPTFLHPDFKNNPVLDFLKGEKRKLYMSSAGWREEALGYGWAWDDYNDNYMVERSPFPLHGNMADYTLRGMNKYGRMNATANWNVSPNYFTNFLDSNLVLPYNIAARAEMADTSLLHRQLGQFSLQRKRTANDVALSFGERKFSGTEIPFYTDVVKTAVNILAADYALQIKNQDLPIDNSMRPDFPAEGVKYTIKSQPTDSMLKPMMHRSDNFFAEQTLLMVSNEKLGYMNDAAIIDTLLKSDLKDLPQRPKWVDGSGLSRYNLFTPQSMVQLLVKMKAEFGLERLKKILATGGEGTLGNTKP